jgi:cobaltochelatase CobT
MAEQLSKTGTKVEVVFKGDGAYTDGSKIVLPAGDSLEKMTPEQQGVLAGFVDHEAAHILYTDMDAYGGHEKRSAGNPFFHELVNACEDMRIEPQMMRNWAGTRANFEDVSRAVNERTFKAMKHVEDKADFASEEEWLPVVTTWEGRKRMGINVDLHNQMLDMMTPSVRKLASQLCDRIATMKDGREGTRQVIDLVSEIVEDWDKIKESVKSDDGDESDDKGDSDGDDGDLGTAGGGEAKEDAEAVKAEREDRDAATATEAETKVKATGDKWKDIKVKSSGLASEVVVGPAATGYRNVVGEPMFHHRTSPPMMMFEARRHDWDRKVDVSQAKVMNQLSGDTTYQYDMDALRGNVATMRTKLRRALMAKRDRVWDAGYKSGRFDARRIVPALRGAEDVYMRRRSGDDIDTAVQIVVDCSGSMGGEKITLARKTAVALSSALEGTGVTYEIVGFTSLRTAKDEVEKKMIRDHMRMGESSATLYGALDRVHIYEFKRFDEPLREAKRAIGNMDDMWLMENNDADSLLAVYPRLKKRHEQRKIMMVLSDGSPCCETYGGTHTILNRQLKKVVSMIEADGVNLIGIGIMTDAPRHFYTKHEVVMDLNSLSGRVIDNISKMLLGERFNADNAKVASAA